MANIKLSTETNVYIDCTYLCSLPEAEFIVKYNDIERLKDILENINYFDTPTLEVRRLLKNKINN